MRLTLGNSAPIEVHHHDESNPLYLARTKGRGGTLVKRGVNQDTGKDIHDLVIDLDPTESHTTEVIIPDEYSIMEAVATICGVTAESASHAWAYHSKAAPGWVLVDVAEDATDEEKHRALLIKSLIEDRFGILQPGPDEITALVTNAGLDYAAKQLGGAASNSAIATFMALTANATAPGATDTTLTAEITTASGGLIRKSATYAHTTGASTYTLTATFTANGSDTLPVTVNKMGIFDASSSGNMPFETAVSPALTFNGSGDAGTITETVTV